MSMMCVAMICACATLCLGDAERGNDFDEQRKGYWPRRECSAYQVAGNDLPDDIRAALNVFGFNVT